MEKIQIKVLLVEDNPFDTELLQQLFIRAHQQEWEIVNVEQLSEAIDVCTGQTIHSCDNSSPLTLNPNSIDVVLLDLSLPDSMGLDTLKEFRIAVPDIPVVVLTGLNDEEMALQAMAEGAQDYLVKDEITIQSLPRAIRYAIERAEILKQLRESEQHTRKALLKEQELNKLKSDFVAMISHEFRTPMSTICTSLDLLQTSDKLTQEWREQFFRRIENALKQMLKLLDEVLFLSKNEVSQFKLQIAHLNLINFCYEIVESIQFSEGKNHKIEFAASGECFEAEMDEELLGSILNNLLSNAIKYSPSESTIYFYLTCQDNMAKFQIKDNGIGIPKKDQIHLCETFFRGSNVGKISGTGLGLAIVRRCVDLHHGYIQVESEENVGTIVTVTLPLH
ncbi:ATP-binding protein [Chlorogloeopsis sp. ULAP01]|uniref:hybrid sensor histidine kinase/response regulator n=1 Tax=Chlorogloeopsis sp. ULAP01 TaxID=3056483 RepID=UPI0025AB433C|nr:ATP-binding protein [Chlorogloeopsis sp. ULAP01]MDM9380032.1 ATP-binding protein [Chlorogloeopsis sp. ULAP01]